MVKRILCCQTCANQVNGEYCTMHKEMSEHRYKRCDGYKQYIAPVKEVYVLKLEEKTNYEELGTFGKFLSKGGHHSFRSGEYIGVPK